MIKSITGKATRQFIETGKSKFSGMDQELAKRRLATLHAAASLDNIGALRSVGLHKLKGDRAGFWAISISGPWRLVFRFAVGHAHDVEIADYY